MTNHDVDGGAKGGPVPAGECGLREPMITIRPSEGARFTLVPWKVRNCGRCYDPVSAALELLAAETRLAANTLRATARPPTVANRCRRRESKSRSVSLPRGRGPP